MSLSIGIVGLPNVGKSTLFTALTRKGGLAANYPFATIDPNVGIVDVPDARLQKLAEIVNPGRIMPATVEFVDIAGLVKGANEGEGLGNQFLANIRNTDAICEVVRYFKDPDVIHVEGRVNPDEDVDIIQTELILADLGTIERALPKLEKEAKRDKDLQPKLNVAKRLQEWLNEGNRAADMEMTDEERLAARDLFLLTMKPILYVANVDEDMLTEPAPVINGVQSISVCAGVEAELADLDPEEAAEYLESLGLERSGLETLAQAAYKLLGLQSYFTAGPMEVRAWTVRIGAKAPEAAGVIHSDFERGFIKAEVASYNDYVELGGEAGCKTAGKLRIEGKEYVVEDGDVMHFRFNVYATKLLTVNMKRARRSVFSPVFVWDGVVSRIARRCELRRRCWSRAAASWVPLALWGLIGAQDYGDVHVSWVGAVVCPDVGGRNIQRFCNANGLCQARTRAVVDNNRVGWMFQRAVGVGGVTLSLQDASLLSCKSLNVGAIEHGNFTGIVRLDAVDG